MELSENTTLASNQEARALAARASKVFQPRTPITTKDLFAGRWSEFTKISEAVNQPGLHVVIYGERGVGKTSLANVVQPIIHALDSEGAQESARARLIVKAIGNTGDTFHTIWEKLLAEISWPEERTPIGIASQTKRHNRSTRDAFSLSGELTIDNVRSIVSMLPGSVFIVDEFDRTADGTSRLFTDLMKTLSDLVVDCTIILVGVSDTVGSLIADHASISRALVQIPLPRMQPEDLRGILTNAERSLEIDFSQDAASLIVHVSQGLPHYTHLLGLHSMRNAVLRRLSRVVVFNDVLNALENAIKEAEQSVTQTHSEATHSSHKDALYRHVLLACALAAGRSRDSMGYFTPGDVVQPLSTILGRQVSVATFSNHVSEFSQPKRGNVLEKDGQPWGFRYRFMDPLLVPFAFINAVQTGLVSGEFLLQILNDSAYFP